MDAARARKLADRIGRMLVAGDAGAPDQGSPGSAS